MGSGKMYKAVFLDPTPENKGTFAFKFVDKNLAKRKFVLDSLSVFTRGSYVDKKLVQSDVYKAFKLPTKIDKNVYDHRDRTIPFKFSMAWHSIWSNETFANNMSVYYLVLSAQILGAIVLSGFTVGPVLAVTGVITAMFYSVTQDEASLKTFTNELTVYSQFINTFFNCNKNTHRIRGTVFTLRNYTKDNYIDFFNNNPPVYQAFVYSMLMDGGIILTNDGYVLSLLDVQEDPKNKKEECSNIISASTFLQVEDLNGIID